MNFTVPTAWLEAAVRLEIALKTSVFLAGGSLRDRVLDRPIKDLDFFCVTPWGMTEWQVLKLLRAAFPNSAVMRPEGPESSGDGQGDVFAVFDIDGVPYGCPSIQLICLGQEYAPLTMDKVLDRFDFGICRIGAESLGGLTVRPEFTHDAKNKAFTLVHQSREMGVHLARYTRLTQEKYRGWEMVIRPDSLKPAPDTSFEF